MATTIDNQDNKEIVNEREKAMILDYSTLSKMVLSDMTLGNKQSTQISNYTKDNVITYLAKPNQYQTQLRMVSNNLYMTSNQYKRLVNYFSKMPTFDYVVVPFTALFDNSDVQKYQKAYAKVVQYVETMNIKHEFSKALNIAFREDVFFGYEIATKDSYFFMRLSADYCQISSIEDGVYNFAFNFDFFNKNPEKLKLYPSEFQKKFKTYQSKGNTMQWQELDSKMTICIKINEDLDYTVPPLASTFLSLYDLEDYKNLKKVQQQLGSYKLLIQEIPMKKDSDRMNDFLVDFQNVSFWHNRADSVLPDEIGLISTPLKVSAVDFSKASNENRDTVADAERDYYNTAGVSQLLFNNIAGAGVGLQESITTDETIVFAILRQFERWMNRKLKGMSGKYFFGVNMLNNTIYNQQTQVDNYLKAGQYGLPVKSFISASLGLSPSAMVNMLYLENVVLDLANSFVPLASSHTTSLTGSQGQGQASGNQSGTTQANDPNAQPQDTTSPKGKQPKPTTKNGN
jgi:hypothetical protein